MGRRKIEIKAIKDDRNRSVYVDSPMLHALFRNRPLFHSPHVTLLHFHSLQHISIATYGRRLIVVLSTFLKRKGGLFKKAHELSVLCSVEVAVIIFGHNKKLYEYSSHDINETIGKFQYVCVQPLMLGQ